LPHGNGSLPGVSRAGYLIAKRVIANCLTAPTSMTLNKKTGTLYVSEFGGRIIPIPFQ
jgi:hypothetical protein